MVTVSMDAATKRLILDPAPDLTKEELTQAERAVAVVNRLMADLVPLNGEVPPPPPVLSKNVSVSAAKLANNGVQAVQQHKYSEAIKLLSTALEMVLRRPLWESTAATLEEVSKVLGPRCDAYIASQMWPEAYADASMLLLMRPQDASSYYRKAVTLLSCGRGVQARELLVTAVSMAPGNAVFKQTLANFDEKTGGSPISA